MDDSGPGAGNDNENGSQRDGDLYRLIFRAALDGMALVDRDGRIVDYREKPTLSYDVSMGVYVFRREILDLIPDGYFDFPDLVLELIKRGRPIRGYAFDGLWLDIGRSEDYAQAIETFENAREQFLPE